MPPSLTRPNYAAAAYDPALASFEDRPADDRLPIGSAGAIILGLSVAAWIIVVQGMRLVATLIG